jgi:hypothetical protein
MSFLNIRTGLAEGVSVLIPFHPLSPTFANMLISLTGKDQAALDTYRSLSYTFIANRVFAGDTGGGVEG